MNEKESWDDGYLTALCCEPKTCPPDCLYPEAWYLGYDQGVEAFNCTK